MYMYMYLHVCGCATDLAMANQGHEQSVIETMQSKATTPKDNPLFSQESCLRWDSNLQCSAY